jgi:predicted aconitase
MSLLGDKAVRPKVPIYVNTGRETLESLRRDGKLVFIEDRNIRIVADTCTYLTAILERLDGAVMTNSGKWAHYAPANLGVKVAFGSMEDCVASAIAGSVVRVGG